MRLLTAILLITALPAAAGPALIGHPGLPPLDRTTVQRIYTGKVVELGGIRITPVDLPPGNPLRARFLAEVLDQDEDKYTGYWTVRRYVGKGTPPPELGSPSEVIDFVQKTEGAIGYVDESDLRPGLEVLLRLTR